MRALTQPPLNGMSYEELRGVRGVQRLDADFLGLLEQRETQLYQRLLVYREGEERLPPQTASGLLLDLAPHLERFIAKLFGIEAEMAESQAATLSDGRVPAFKKAFARGSPGS